jgi:RHS repeat-associated protein
LSGNAQNRPTGLAYDAAGNLTSYLSANYTYDQENRLSSTASTSYTYDGNGERALKSNTSTGAAVKRYWSMGGNTLAESDSTGNLTAEYIYFGGRRVARIDLPANTVHYYLSDHLSSTSIVASAAGAVEEESDYYPFGTEVIVTGPGVNELKFTGKRRDTESQLDYFGARYYSSTLGRFLSPDWSAKPTPVPYAEIGDPQSLNLFSYVRNVPTTHTDPSGHKIEYLPNKKNAEEANRRILSNVSKDEKKLFKMEKDKDSGKYQLKFDAKAAANFKGEHTVGFDKLVTAVNSDKTATVSVQSTLGARGDDGQLHVYNVARDFGGGTTYDLGNGNSLVALSPEGNSAAPDQWHTLGPNGGKVADPVGIIAGHEVLGHALERMIGGDTSENKAQQVETQLRQEQGIGERVP